MKSERPDVLDYALIPILCGQIYFLLNEIDKVIKNSEKRIERLKQAPLETYSETLRDYFFKEVEKLQALISELLHIKVQTERIRDLVCSEETSAASLLKSKNMLEKLYLKYIMGKVKLPGHIAPLLYQVYSTIQKL